MPNRITCEADGSVEPWDEPWPNRHFALDRAGLVGDLSGVANLSVSENYIAALNTSGFATIFDHESVVHEVAGVKAIHASGNYGFVLEMNSGSFETAMISVDELPSSKLAQMQSVGVREFVHITSAWAALLSDETVITWAKQSATQWNDVVEADLVGVKKIATTSMAFAALLSDGSVKTWGHDVGGKVPYAVRPEIASGVVDVVGGGSAFAAIKEEGHVVAWGYVNPVTGITEAEASPPADLDNVKALFSNEDVFAALRHDGSVVAWGRSDKGGELRRQSNVLPKTQRLQASIFVEGPIVEYCGGSAVNSGLLLQRRCGRGRHQGQRWCFCSTQGRAWGRP